MRELLMRSHCSWDSLVGARYHVFRAASMCPSLASSCPPPPFIPVACVYPPTPALSTTHTYTHTVPQKDNILDPLKHSHLFKSSLAGIDRGVLLYGPPGTGKSMLAKVGARFAG